MMFDIEATLSNEILKGALACITYGFGDLRYDTFAMFG